MFSGPPRRGDGAFYESQAARDADIEAGPGRTAAELEADVRPRPTTCSRPSRRPRPEALAVKVPRLRVVDDPAGQQLISGRATIGLRLREVILHHCDLDAGYTLAEAPPDWVTGEIAYRPAGSPTAPAVLVDAGPAGSWRYGRQDGEPVTVSGTPVALLGWITGRGPREGLTSSSGTVPDLGPWA